MSVGGEVTPLDLEVLSTLVQGASLTEEQDDSRLQLSSDLAELRRDAVSVNDLARLVCTVLDAKAVPADSSSDTSVRPATRRAAQEQREKEVQAERDRLDGVKRSLSLVLLDDANANVVEALVSDKHLDAAFTQYTHLLGASPTALQRHWETGQSVLCALNELHGEDQRKVYSGILTRNGMELYLQIVRDLSKGNRNKVSAKAIATEWNVRVEQMLTSAQTERAKEQIRRDFGFVGTKDAQRHADRLTLRVEQTQQASSIAEGIIEICSTIKELSTPVREVQLDTALPSTVQRGVGGPAAKVLEPSALRPERKRSAPTTTVTEDEDRMDEAETKNHCYLCSLNGRPLGECCIEATDTKVLVEIGGCKHSRKKKRVVCAWFDERFPEGHVDRDAKLAHAARVKKNALQSFSRRKRRELLATKI